MIQHQQTLHSPKMDLARWQGFSILKHTLEQQPSSCADMTVMALKRQMRTFLCMESHSVEEALTLWGHTALVVAPDCH